MTTQFADVDTGLVKQGTELPVRCEIIAVARAPQAAVAAAVVGVAKAARAGGEVAAQPGVLVPNIESALDEASDITVSHGMLIAPYLGRAFSTSRRRRPAHLRVAADHAYSC